MTISNWPVRGPRPLARLTLFWPNAVTVHESALRLVTKGGAGQRIVPSLAIPWSAEVATRNAASLGSKTGNLPSSSVERTAFSDSSYRAASATPRTLCAPSSVPPLEPRASDRSPRSRSSRPRPSGSSAWPAAGSTSSDKASARTISSRFVISRSLSNEPFHQAPGCILPLARQQDSYQPREFSDVVGNQRLGFFARDAETPTGKFRDNAL